ncbi:MAG: L-2,4-diaminobutyric acid acetyltransferase [Sediminicola sp.]|jgi:L-2,4-diaminobutyric acid acetyltransferase
MHLEKHINKAIISSSSTLNAMPTFTFRSPTLSDGPDMYDLVKSSGNLDLNSRYCYLLLGTHFSETCLVGFDGSEMIGVICAYRPPEKQNCLFVWQITTAEEYRTKGIADSMLDHLVKKLQPTMNCIEATVCLQNDASLAFFESFASKKNTAFKKDLIFPTRLFKEDAHEDEYLINIGPL